MVTQSFLAHSEKLHEVGEGWVYLHKYVGSEYGDESSRQAARKFLVELSIFYLMVILGFGMLYFTWRSNARLKVWKMQLEDTITAQKGRSFEPQDAAKLYG